MIAKYVIVFFYDKVLNINDSVRRTDVKNISLVCDYEKIWSRTDSWLCGFIFDCFIENFNQKHPYYFQEVALVNCIWDGVI